MENGISKAVRLAGSQTALAHALDVRPEAVQRWEAQGFAPAARCLAIELYLQRAVSRHELNPKVFGAAEQEST